MTHAKCRHSNICSCKAYEKFKSQIRFSAKYITLRDEFFFVVSELEWTFMNPTDFKIEVNITSELPKTEQKQLSRKFFDGYYV